MWRVASSAPASTPRHHRVTAPAEKGALTVQPVRESLAFAKSCGEPRPVTGSGKDAKPGKDTTERPLQLPHLGSRRMP